MSGIKQYLSTPNVYWTWVWVNSGSWWWTGRPGVLRFMGLQIVRHDWATELNWTECYWTARRSNQSVLEEINPEHSLEGLMLKLKLQYFGHLMWRLIRKDPDAGKDWRQEEETTEDKMVGWHHWLNGHEFQQALGDGEGQGSLVCCSPWGCRVEHDSDWIGCIYKYTNVYWDAFLRLCYSMVKFIESKSTLVDARGKMGVSVKWGQNFSLCSVVSNSVIPWTVTCQASVHRISQARILKWVAISSSKGSYWPRDQTLISYISCISRQILYH